MVDDFVVSLVGDVVPVEGGFDDLLLDVVHRSAGLIGRPGVEKTFDALAVGIGGVGVFGRVPAAVGMLQRCEHVPNGLDQDLTPLRLAEHNEGVEVGPHK